MKNMGVSFEVPNEYRKFLSDRLEPLPYDDYQWLVNHDEIHLVNDDDLIEDKYYI